MVMGFVGTFELWYFRTAKIFKEMTSNIFIIIAFGVGFKCPRKIHLSTQCPPRIQFRRPCSKHMAEMLVLPCTAAPELKLMKLTKLLGARCNIIIW